MVPMLEVLVMDEDEAVEKDVVPKEEAKESTKASLSQRAKTLGRKASPKAKWMLLNASCVWSMDIGPESVPTEWCNRLSTLRINHIKENMDKHKTCLCGCWRTRWTSWWATATSPWFTCKQLSSFFDYGFNSAQNLYHSFWHSFFVQFFLFLSSNGQRWRWWHARCGDPG